MKHFLFMRIDAPIQSWGTSSYGSERRTEREPTKSGIIGVIANAMGISNDDDQAIRGLANNLVMGIRVDREGTIMRDYHTTTGLATLDHKIKKMKNNDMSVDLSNRYYLNDFVFLVALSGEKELLQEIENALLNPKIPMFLGRKCCPLALPLVPVIPNVESIQVFASMKEAFLSFPLLRNNNNDIRLMLEVECDNDTEDDIPVYVRYDIPESFSIRRYKRREVYEKYIKAERIPKCPHTCLC